MEPSENRPGATRATRWTIWLSLAAVSATAAVASYIHALAVVRAADGNVPVAWFIAALADPAIFAASVNILDASRRGLPRPRWSVVSVVVAVVVTLGANVAAGNPHAVPSWLVNVWPPVAFVMALESLTSYVRRGQHRAAGVPAAAAVTAQPPAAHVGADPREWLNGVVRSLADSRTDREVAVALGISRGRVRAALDEEPPAGTDAHPPAQAVPAGLNGHGGHDG